MVRRLGAKRWQQLHRLVYAIGIGAVVHFLWLVNSDICEPLVYAVILTLLLGFRNWNKTHSSRTTVPSGTVP
jgi:sulfoxide reductase heme-binding subunit YedZ